MVSKIEISHRTIIFTVLFLIALWALVQLREILFLLFISFILMTALRPLVDRLTKFKIPRVLAILVVYTMVFGVFGVTLAGAVPTLITQFQRLIQDLPRLVSAVAPYWNIDVRSFSQQLAPLGENVFRVTLGIFSNILAVFTVLVVTFYLLLERRNVEVFMVETLGRNTAVEITAVLRLIEDRLGAWVRGQLILMTWVGVCVYLGLTVLHIDYALPLAILAFSLEIIPMVGPNIAAIPAVLVGLNTSPFLALSVAALYFIIQQIQNNLVVPMVIKRSVGLSPVITIVAFMIGGKFGGAVGAVLAVPFLVVGQVLASAVLNRSSKELKSEKPSN